MWDVRPLLGKQAVWLAVAVFGGFVLGFVWQTWGAGRLRLYQRQTAQANLTPTPTSLPSPTPSVTPTPTPIIVPVYLRIPKLGIDTVVESVGLTKDGNMDTPANAKNVGWYRYGTVPGSRGNAVISGHYDTASGKPAVFYHLNSLSVGDTVGITLRGGETIEFTVTGKDSIPYQTFPSGYVFLDKPGINLNLITCGGIWDPKKRLYTKRIVVYTTLKGSSQNIIPDEKITQTQ
jgi:sortase (surface protein transpeptidase)